MAFGMVNKQTIVNRFVFHTLHRNFTHLARITHKTTMKIKKFGRKIEKKQRSFCEQINYLITVNTYVLYNLHGNNTRLGV